MVFTALYANPNTPRKELMRLTGRSRRWVQRAVAEWLDQGPEEHEEALERMRSVARYGAELQMRRFVRAALAAMAREPEPGEEHKLAADVQKWATIFGLDAPQRVVVAEVEQPWERILAAVTGQRNDEQGGDAGGLVEVEARAEEHEGPGEAVGGEPNDDG